MNRVISVFILDIILLKSIFDKFGSFEEFDTIMAGLLDIVEVTKIVKIMKMKRTIIEENDIMALWVFSSEYSVVITDIYFFLQTS